VFEVRDTAHIVVDGEPLSPLGDGDGAGDPWHGSVGAHVRYWCSRMARNNESCEIDGHELVSRHLALGVELGALLAFKTAAILQMGGVERAKTDTSLWHRADGARIARTRNPSASGLYDARTGELCVARWQQLHAAALPAVADGVAFRICPEARLGTATRAPATDAASRAAIAASVALARASCSYTLAAPPLDPNLRLVTRALLERFAQRANASDPDMARVLSGWIAVRPSDVTGASFDDLYRVLEPRYWVVVTGDHAVWQAAWSVGDLARFYYDPSPVFAAHARRRAHGAPAPDTVPPPQWTPPPPEANAAPYAALGALSEPQLCS
jgi:hypothetical protein